ncbi:MAG TPA: IPT/TIG domain-containing protein [Pyrinomonadaceae bacterium]
MGQQSVSITYTYDSLNRLTGVTYSNGGAVVYTYDAAGNRKTIRITGALPFINSVSPASAAAGGPAFTLTVNGQNFASGAVVQWGGADRPTTFVSGSQLTAGINAGDIASPGSFNVTVVNPSGGGTSNAVGFNVTAALRIDSVAPPAGRASGGQQVTLTGSFPGLPSVQWGGVQATIVSSSATQLTVSTPQHAVGAVAVTLVPSSGNSYTKANAFAYLPTVFTDDTLVAGVTTGKGRHVTELREAVDALRAVAGLSPAPWQDPQLPPSNAIIRAVHVQELRKYLEEAAARLGYPSVNYIDPDLGTGYVIRLVHINEIRQRIRAIAR